MAQFIQEAFTASKNDKSVLNPKALKKTVQMKFMPTLQHDSHEFLMHLLGEIQDEETPVNLRKFDGEYSKNPNRSMREVYEQYFVANPSIIDNIFTGINRSVVKCMNGSCQYESVMFKPFSALSLEMSPSLDRSLKKHFEASTFDSDNKYKCEKCEKKTRAKHFS